MSLTENLEKMLAAGTDNALLRFGLGNAYLHANDPERAVGHLRRAVEHDPGYSAAWKLLGKALEAAEPAQAAQAWRSGIAAAEAKGDKQAAREMQVFLRRLERGAGNG